MDKNRNTTKDATESTEGTSCFFSVSTVCSVLRINAAGWASCPLFEKRWTRRQPYGIILSLLLCTAGCNYSQSGDAPNPNSNYRWRSLYREDVKSVAVPIFTNKAFDRGVEFSLTEAIVKQIEARTPYKVMPRERADTVLEGEVVSVSRSVVSNDARSAIPQEQLYIVRVNFVWKDLHTGRILCERKNFEQTAIYYPTQGEGRYVGQQQNAEKLATGIVQELAADW